MRKKNFKLQKKSEKSQILIRLKAVGLLIGLAGLAVLSRTVQIQVLKDPRLERLAQRQVRSTVLVSPSRGLVLDRNGVPLAINQETYSLAANPHRVQNPRKLSKKLRKNLGVNAKRTLKRLRSKKGFVWIKRHLTESEAKTMRHWVKGSSELAGGLWLVRESKRVYPHGNLATPIIGSVDVDSQGIAGIELWKNETLAGKGNRPKAMNDALGRSAFIDTVSDRKIENGQSIRLTIDASLQDEVESLLTERIKTTGSKGGIVIVMDAVTGDLLSMASKPNDPYHKNRALTDGYEPGSTMKPLLLASALSWGYAPGHQIHGGNGSMRLQGHRISEAETDEKFKKITVKEMVQFSSNVVSAKLALELGKKRFLKTLDDLQFSRKTGSGFPGEISGRFPRKKVSQIRLANMGFGQGILVTPLQMTRAYASIINGGWLVRPNFILTDQVSSKRARPIRVFSREVVEEVLDAMVAATDESGTGRKAVPPGFLVAGKTGTAQDIDRKTRRYSRKLYNSSFIGFPVGMEKKIVVFTMLEHPRKGSYYASETAAPLFREVLRAAANRFGLPVSEELVALRKVDRISMMQSSVQKVKYKGPSATKPRWQSISQDGVQVWKMPSLAGLSSREVLRSLEGHDFKLKLNGFGKVIAQKPSAGSVVRDGTLVEVRLGD